MDWIEQTKIVFGIIDQPFTYSSTFNKTYQTIAVYPFDKSKT